MWVVTIASGQDVTRTDFVAARAETLLGSSTFRDVWTSTSTTIVGTAVRNKTTLPIPYRLNQLVVFSCNVHGNSPVLHSHFRSKSRPTCAPPLVVMFSQTESCPHKNGVFRPTHKLSPSGMHLQRRHKITDLLKSINRNSIDAFVSPTVFSQNRGGFYGWHVLTLNKWFRNGAFRISNSCPCTSVSPTITYLFG